MTGISAELIEALEAEQARLDTEIRDATVGRDAIAVALGTLRAGSMPAPRAESPKARPKAGPRKRAVKTVTCACGKVCGSAAGYSRHRKACPAVKTSSEPKAPPAKPKVGVLPLRIECDGCGLTFDGRAELARHRRAYNCPGSRRKDAK